MREEEQQVRKVSNKLCPQRVCAIYPDGNSRQKNRPKKERRRYCGRECKVRNHGPTSTKKKEDRWSKETQGSLGGFFSFPALKEKNECTPKRPRTVKFRNIFPSLYAGSARNRNKGHTNTLDPLLIFSPTIEQYGLVPFLKKSLA